VDTLEKNAPAASEALPQCHPSGPETISGALKRSEVAKVFH